MKNKNLSVAIIAAQMTINNVLMGDIYDGPFEGDLSGDISTPVSVGYGDIEEDDSLEGAPRGVKQNTSKRTANVARRKLANKTGAGAATALPGIALQGTMLSPFEVDNARIAQPGTNQKISGNLLKFNLDENPIRNPFLTKTKIVGGDANPGNAVTIAFNDDDKPAECQIFSAPIVFGVIASAQLSARAGSRYKLQILGKSRDGVTITSDEWEFERKNTNDAIRFKYIPYIRQKDSLVPLSAAFGDIGGEINNIAFTVKLTGMPDTESLQVTMPGMDSKELQEYLATWGLTN